jgi:hypothetical protein
MECPKCGAPSRARIRAKARVRILEDEAVAELREELKKKKPGAKSPYSDLI